MKKPKRKQTVLQKIAAEILFWFHTAVIVLMMVAGLFWSIWVVVAILIVHRIHLYIFHGCLITKLEEKEGGIPRGMAYFQLAFKRFFGIKLSKKGVQLVSIASACFGLAVALVASAEHFRLHL